MLVYRGGVAVSTLPERQGGKAAERQSHLPLLLDLGAIRFCGACEDLRKAND